MSGERSGPIEADLRGLISRKLNAGDLNCAGGPRCDCTSAPLADCTGGPGCVCTAVAMGMLSGTIEPRLDLVEGVAGPPFPSKVDPPACGVLASVLPVVVVVDMVGEAILPSEMLVCKGKQIAPLGRDATEAADERTICCHDGANWIGFLAWRRGERVGDRSRRVWITGDHEATCAVPCAVPGDDRMAAWHHGSEDLSYPWVQLRKEFQKTKEIHQARQAAIPLLLTSLSRECCDSARMVFTGTSLVSLAVFLSFFCSWARSRLRCRRLPGSCGCGLRRFFLEPSCLLAVRLQTTTMVEGLGHY